MRRTKDLVAADLPAKTEQILELDLYPAHRRIYDRRLQRERQKLLGLVEDIDAHRFEVFRSLTLLRQLSLDSGLAGRTPARRRSWTPLLTCCHGRPRKATRFSCSVSSPVSSAR